MAEDNLSNINGNAWPIWSKYVLKSIEQIVNDITKIWEKMSSIQETLIRLASIIDIELKKNDIDSYRNRVNDCENKIILLEEKIANFESQGFNRDKRSAVIGTSSAAIIMALIEIIKELIKKV